MGEVLHWQICIDYIIPEETSGTTRRPGRTEPTRQAPIESQHKTCLRFEHWCLNLPWLGIQEGLRPLKTKEV